MTKVRKTKYKLYLSFGISCAIILILIFVGLKNTEKSSKTEDELIQQEISMWIPEMSTVLENIPKQMILILKTNDLLRGLETTLNVRPDANCFITMSKYEHLFQSQIDTFQCHHAS